MKVRRTSLIVHLIGAAAASAILAYWALALWTLPAPGAPAAGAPAYIVREPDPALAARMFGDVGAAQGANALNVQVSGVFAAGRASSAVISVDGKPARAVLLGHELVDGVRLSEVRRDGVTLEHDGALSQYSVPEAAVATASAPTTSFRREGATLTAPSVEPAPGAARSAAPLPQAGAAAQASVMPGHDFATGGPRHPGPVQPLQMLPNQAPPLPPPPPPPPDGN